MSIANLKDSGNQGNNMPWQWKMLLGQQGALDQLIAINASTDQVEGLLNQILAAILTGQDYEAMLVVDAANITWLEVRIYNPDTGTFNPPIYFQAGNNTPGTPTAPITYINPNTYLATIASNTTGLATQTTLAAINNKLVNGNDIGDVTVNNGAGASAVNIQDGGNSITVDGGTGIARTPGMIRPTGSGNVSSAAATFYSVSVANVGAANGTVLAGAVTIKPGEVLNFSADAINNYFTSFAYNATGTEFIIIYVA
jgi:hypothetical protein